MDLLSFAVVFVILVASGGIAWIADGLGKKIGKKRISVRFRGWSMRPKHVASLGTVAMGVIVSGLTIGFIAGVSRDAREWLKQGRGLLVQRDELKRSVEDQKAQLGGLNKTIRDDHRRIESEETLLGHRKDELDRLDLRIKGLNEQVERKNTALFQAKMELNERQRAIDGLQARLPRLQSRIASAQERVNATSATLVKVTRHLALVLADLKTSSISLRTAKHNVAVAWKNANQAYSQNLQTYKENLTLTEEREGRLADIKALKQEQASLIEQRDDYQMQAEAAGTQAQAAIGSYEKTKAELDQVEQALVQQHEAFQKLLDTGFRTSRTEAMTFRKGEEIARLVVPAGSNVETTRNALASLLRAARVEATARGAKGRRGFEAADIADRRDAQTGEVSDADTLKRVLAANLAGRTEDQVLVATSSLNAFAGEPVSLDLMAMPNPVVYRRNDTVAETRIDGGQTEDRILADLSAFVNGDVRQRAQKDRMIPRSGTSAPYGEPSAANVWSLLQSVRKAGRKVRVQAVAEDDIRAADPLRLEFRVR